MTDNESTTNDKKDDCETCEHKAICDRLKCESAFGKLGIAVVPLNKLPDGLPPLDQYAKNLVARSCADVALLEAETGFQVMHMQISRNPHGGLDGHASIAVHDIDTAQRITDPGTDFLMARFDIVLRPATVGTLPQIRNEGWVYADDDKPGSIGIRAVLHPDLDEPYMEELKAALESDIAARIRSWCTTMNEALAARRTAKAKERSNGTH